MNDTPHNSKEDQIERTRAGYLLVKVETVFDPLLERSGKEESIGGAIGELAEHLRSTILAASIPFLLIRQSVVEKRLQAIHSSEQIRAIDPKDVIDKKPYRGLSFKATGRALQTAQAKLAAELAGGEGQREIYRQIRCELRRGLDDAEAGVAAQELLNQAMVGVWTAFEVFAKNVAKSIVNQQPTKGLSLLTSDVTRAYFGGKGTISADILAYHGFDLKNSMGDAIFSSQKLDSLPAIRALFEVLFPSMPEISKGLKDKNLWLLNQRRHLLVHRRGIVDRIYVLNTEDKLPLGERLSIKGEELESYLSTVRDLALVIAAATQA